MVGLPPRKNISFLDALTVNTDLRNLQFQQKGEKERGMSAYIHVPFCVKRCGYCDFNTYIPSELLSGATRSALPHPTIARNVPQTQLFGKSAKDYVVAVKKEIQDAANALKSMGVDTLINTVFFGGGTPSLLQVGDIRSILNTLNRCFSIKKNAEITIECNPDTVTREYIVGLITLGVSRLSFGVQSFDLDVLKVLDRTHSVKNVSSCAKWAKEEGIEFSFDLIYGTPNETLDSWRRTIEHTIDLGPNHISAYALTIEEGTKMHRQIKRGEIPPIDTGAQAEMYALADCILEECGYSWYEISNWSRSANTQCKHNKVYWRGGNWWGFGPGAHGHINGCRFWNVKHPQEYFKRICSDEGADFAILDFEVLTCEQMQLEACMLGIRMREGLSLDFLKSYSSYSLRDLDDLAKNEYIVWDQNTREGNISLTLKGRLFADFVIRQLGD